MQSGNSLVEFSGCRATMMAGICNASAMSMPKLVFMLRISMSAPWHICQAWRAAVSTICWPCRKRDGPLMSMDVLIAFSKRDSLRKDWIEGPSDWNSIP
ncbi:hypothetical protein D3C87_2003990 [compost metagenome]